MKCFLKQLEATFAGKCVRLWRGRNQRLLSWIGGEVSTGCPITLRYRGSKNKALKKAEQLRRYGYRVEVKRCRKVPALNPEPHQAMTNG